MSDIIGLTPVVCKACFEYRVADLNNVAEVALEGGNSRDIIFQHYRDLGRVRL